MSARVLVAYVSGLAADRKESSSRCFDKHFECRQDAGSQASSELQGVAR